MEMCVRCCEFAIFVHVAYIAIILCVDTNCYNVEYLNISTQLVVREAWSHGSPAALWQDNGCSIDQNQPAHCRPGLWQCHRVNQHQLNAASRWADVQTQRMNTHHTHTLGGVFWHQINITVVSCYVINNQLPSVLIIFFPSLPSGFLNTVPTFPFFYTWEWTSPTSLTTH